MISIFLSLVLIIYPIKPDMTIKLKDISIFKSLSAMRLVGFKTDFLPIIPKEGIIGSLIVEFRGNLVMINVTKINIKDDPIRWIKICYNRKNEFWHMKAEALGGLIELEGIMPK